MTRKRVVGRSKLVWIGCALLLPAAALPHAQDLAPPSPGRPWSPPRLSAVETELARSTKLYANCPVANLDPAKVYSLPELIDIAECNNPQTRSAWEKARSAAASIGLSKSAYLPSTSATRPRVRCGRRKRPST